MEERIKRLEEKVAELEVRIQEQPSIETIALANWGQEQRPVAGENNHNHSENKIK